jgi:tetratricopeptide (TPR) repeat protein
MSVAFDRPTVCPVIVGREAYLAALDTHLDTAYTGRGSVVLLAGEAGIGKSRLVADVRARASTREFLSLAGRCFEPDRTLPYAPLLDLLRIYLAGQPIEARARDLSGVAPELAWLLPELARQEPDVTAVPTFDPREDRRRLAHAFVQFFAHLAATRPLLLVVEDLHWSDDASLDVVLHLARYLAAMPSLLLLTYRNEEINPGLRHMLAMLDRERLGSEMALTPLEPSDVDAMLRAIFDQPQPIRPEFLRAIYDLTDGNPFFIEEVIRSLIAEGEIYRASGRWERRALAELHIPRSVHDAVLRRIHLLSPEAAKVLRLAAVAGRSFDFAVLQELTGDADEQLLDVVRELIGAQLVAEESADRFSFRHALTREAIYADMLARERRALHLKVAETIERLYTDLPEAYLVDLSSHFAAAGEWGKVLDYAERAGRHALNVFALGAAVEHLTRALDASRHLLIAQSPRLHRERGRALALLGDFERALQDYQVVLDLARTAGDRVSEWQALIDLGDLWGGYDYARAGTYFEQALSLSRTLDSPAAYAESLAQLGVWHLNSERTDEAERCLQSALASFEQAGDRHGVARAVDLLGTVSDIAGDVAEMRRRYERAAALFRELGDRQVLSNTLATMCLHGGVDVFATVVIPAGISLDEATAEAEEALSLARATGWRSGEAYAVLSLAVALVWCGHYGRALTLVRDGLAIAQEIDHREWMAYGHVSHGIIYGDLLAWPRALEHFGQAYTLARGSGSLHWLHNTTGYLADVLAMNGNHNEAEEILSSVAADLPMQALGQRRVWVSRAKLALARSDPAPALDIIERLFASALHRTSLQDIPFLARLRGKTLAALNRHEEAESTLHAALQGAGDRGARPLCWRIHLELGHLYRAQGRHVEATQQFRSARDLVADLAATLPDGLRDEFLSQTAALMPADRARGAGRDGDELTARERDVAALVARGLSNRDIGHTLYIGERTVETHVGNILGKLGYTSRAQIAAWAIESGLTRSTG